MMSEVNVIPGEGALVPASRQALRQGAKRLLLYFHVAVAALSLWVAHYPPLGDVPQHAAQVTLALDLLQGHSQWAGIVAFNFFTPYLIGYGLMAAAAQFMPMAAAVKLVLSLSVVAFFWAASALRRRFGAPAFLDWLVLGGFFGFAFKWGFLTFLLAAPVGMFFILKALDFVEQTDRRRLLQLVAVGVLLFFSHGLIFVACVGIGFCYAVLGISSWRLAAMRLLPYTVLGLLALVYFHFARDVHGAQNVEAKAFVWDLTPRRVVRFFRFQWDVANVDKRQPGYVLNSLAFVFFYLAPFLLGMRLTLTLRRVIPFAVLVLIALAVPHTALSTAFLYERFALFLLPFYVLLFSPAQEPATAGGGAMRAFTLAMVPALCLTMTAARAWQFHRFNQESRDFKAILDLMPARQRVLSLMFDKLSPAASNPHTYLHFPCWYQAEKHGFVDSNFAQMLPQIVRFKPGEARVQTPFEWLPYRFDWAKHRGERYDYFVVRSVNRLFPRFLAVPCRVEMVTTSGPWALYRRLPGTCNGNGRQEAPQASQRSGAGE